MGFAAPYPSYRPYPDFAPLHPDYGLLTSLFDILARGVRCEDGIACTPSSAGGEGARSMSPVPPARSALRFTTKGNAKDHRMPRFAANLGHLFTDYPLLERFGAAAACGFSAVELQFPYDTPTAAVKGELGKHGLTVLGVNTPQCPEFGLAALPGRERDFDAAFGRALDY